MLNSATNLGKITIENLPVGEYVLIETKSPTGYLCSAIPWKIEVAKNRTITVTYNGNLVKTRVDGEKTIYQLTNTKVYSLPSTGGSGIYWYMIGGMVLMSTPMLLTVPFASTEEGWIYDVQAYPKAEKSNTAGIIVEKRLYRINPNTFELDEITADDATYKVGLFLDKDGTIPYGDDYIRTIHIQNAQSGKASYSNVLRGTYYVFELDENNKAIKLNDEVQIDKENSFHYNVTNAAAKEDNSVVVDDNTVATDIAAYVNNIFSTLPEGFFVNGKIEITKNVVVDGVKKTVDDKFYATVFDDSGKAVSTVELKQNDKVTVTVPFSEDIKDTVTYAVKETDKDGNVLDKDSFAYVVSGEGSVKLNESDQYHGSIEITNTKKDAAVTPGGSNGGSGTSNGGSDASSHGGSATSRPVKTGDPMNPVFWGLVLLVSVIVIAGGVVVYKKRKQK